jgi:hypothetical protein
MTKPGRCRQACLHTCSTPKDLHENGLRRTLTSTPRTCPRQHRCARQTKRHSSARITFSRFTVMMVSLSDATAQFATCWSLSSTPSKKVCVLGSSVRASPNAEQNLCTPSNFERVPQRGRIENTRVRRGAHDASYRYSMPSRASASLIAATASRRSSRWRR